MKMILRPENVKKSVDSLGRVTLPKGLRDRMFITNGTELEIYTMELPDGTTFICLAQSDATKYEEQAAKEYLESKGYMVEKREAQ